MRRRAEGPTRWDGKFRDPRKDLSQEQLAAIGAISMAFNECESVINAMLFVSFRPPPALGPELIARFSGLEVKVDVVKKAAEHVLGFVDTDLALVRAALDEFVLYKRYRDAIVHAQISDSTVALGIVFSRKAMDEVLLSADALNALYERLWALKHGLDLIAIGFELKAADLSKQEADRVLGLFAEISEGVENTTEQLLAEVQVQHTLRQSLPPIPDFPVPDASAS